MSCTRPGILRMYLDGALDARQSRDIEQHLARCSMCRRALADIRAAARLADDVLRPLAPTAAPDVFHALAELRRRDDIERNKLLAALRRFWMSKRQVWRPVVAGVVVLAILVGVFSFAPSRALARQLLSVFRVNKFAVVRVSPDQAQLEELGRALEENVFSREPEVIVDEPLVTVSSIEEARALAGFDARLPEYLPFEPGMLKIQVKGRTEYALSVPREALVAVLSLAGMGDRDLPADLQEATVRIAMPAAVQMTAPKFALMQVYEPEVDYPEGIDPSLFGEAGLRLMGLQADEARRISRSIDWTNTLVLPVPDDLTEIRELQIAGEEAVLLQPRTRDDYNMTTLLFEKEGIVYVLSARGSYEMLVQVAESMF